MLSNTRWIAGEVLATKFILKWRRASEIEKNKIEIETQDKSKEKRRSKNQVTEAVFISMENFLSVNKQVKKRHKSSKHDLNSADHSNRIS